MLRVVMTHGLSLQIVGVGDAFTSRYFNACILLTCDDTRVLIDAPPALAKALAHSTQSTVSLDDIDHVVITHLHGDHCGGLEQLLFYRRFVTQRKCSLHAIPEVLQHLWDTRLRGGMDTLMDEHGTFHALTLNDYANVCPISQPAHSIGPLQLEWRRTIHHIPTSALRVRAPNNSVWGYSADTAFDPSLIAWLGSADLFFHETNFGTHTPLQKLVALPETSRQRMHLIHYPDSLEPATSPIPCVTEGQVFTL